MAYVLGVGYCFIAAATMDLKGIRVAFWRRGGSKSTGPCKFYWNGSGGLEEAPRASWERKVLPFAEVGDCW